MTKWILLGLAIALEVAGTTSMKLSEGFTKTIPSILVAVFYSASLYMLTLSLKRWDVSTAYAIWSGVGTAMVAVLGVLFFREDINFWKVVSLALIIAGVVGLNLSGAKHG